MSQLEYYETFVLLSIIVLRIANYITLFLLNIGFKKRSYLIRKPHLK